jgi:hypothetical protein
MNESRVVQYINEEGILNTWTYKGNRLVRSEYEYPKIKTKKTKTMSAKQELFEQIAEQFVILKENNEGSTKASQARARKAAAEIKKLITPYKKASLDQVK